MAKPSYARAYLLQLHHISCIVKLLFSIHQPSGELFQSFDRLLLLRKGGQTVYFGDLGKNSSTMISYFERNGARHCDPEENP